MNGLKGGQYKPLSERKIVKIHETSLKILEEVGVKIGLEEALQIFKKHGAKVDGEIVRIPSSMVEETLQVVPHQFLMAGQEEKNDLSMEDQRVYLGTGGAALTVLDLETGEARPGTLRDIARIAKWSMPWTMSTSILGRAFPRTFRKRPWTSISFMPPSPTRPRM